MLSLLFVNPTLFFAWFLSLVVAVTVHEFAHAWTADRLGDPTPRLMGRVTLNPMAHLDPLGTIFMLVTRFGWGRPVQFDHFNLKNPRRDIALIALAGPFSNLITAGIFSLWIHFSLTSGNLTQFIQFFEITIIMNIVLAVFNLLPIHPLDGGKVLVGLLPAHDGRIFDRFMNQYGIFILFILIFPIFGGRSIVSDILSPIINFLLSIFLPGQQFI